MSNSFPSKPEGTNNVPVTPDFGQSQPKPASEATSVGSTPQFNNVASNDYEYVDAPPKTSVLSIVGLVFAFLSPVIGLLISIIAWVTSRSVGNKTTVAIIGTVISLIGTIFSIYFTLAILPTLDLDAYTNTAVN